MKTWLISKIISEILCLKIRWLPRTLRALTSNSGHHTKSVINWVRRPSVVDNTKRSTSFTAFHRRCRRRQAFTIYHCQLPKVNVLESSNDKQRRGIRPTYRLQLHLYKPDSKLQRIYCAAMPTKFDEIPACNQHPCWLSVLHVKRAKIELTAIDTEQNRLRTVRRHLQLYAASLKRPTSQSSLSFMAIVYCN